MALPSSLVMVTSGPVGRVMFGADREEWESARSALEPDRVQALMRSASWTIASVEGFLLLVLASLLSGFLGLDWIRQGADRLMLPWIAACATAALYFGAWAYVSNPHRRVWSAGDVLPIATLVLAVVASV